MFHGEPRFIETDQIPGPCLIQSLVLKGAADISSWIFCHNDKWSQNISLRGHFVKKIICHWLFRRMDILPQIFRHTVMLSDSSPPEICKKNGRTVKSNVSIRFFHQIGAKDAHYQQKKVYGSLQWGNAWKWLKWPKMALKWLVSISREPLVQWT